MDHPIDHTQDDGHGVDPEHSCPRTVPFDSDASAAASRRAFLRTSVKTHVGNVLTKLGAQNRTHAVVIAYESGLVVPGFAG